MTTFLFDRLKRIGTGATIGYLTPEIAFQTHRVELLTCLLLTPFSSSDFT